MSPTLPTTPPRTASTSFSSSADLTPAEENELPSQPRYLQQRMPGGQLATAIRLTGGTPRKRNSASAPSQGDDTHAAVDPYLARELQGQVCYDVSDFVERLLVPSDPVRRVQVETVVDACLAAIPSLDEPLLDQVNGGWRLCRDYVEREFVPEFARLWESIIRVAKDLSSSEPSLNPPSRPPSSTGTASVVSDSAPRPSPSRTTPPHLPTRRHIPNMTRYLVGPNPKVKRKVDFYVTEGDSADSLHWARVQFLAEAKNRVKDATPADVALQIGGYVREVFYAQPHRRFVHALYLLKSEVTLFRFDRSGALASERLDMHKDWQTFVRAVLAYAYMDRLDMGFDTSFIEVPSPSLPPPLPSPVPSPPDYGDGVGMATVPKSSEAGCAPPPPKRKPSSIPFSEPPPPASYRLRIGEQEYLLGQVLDSRKVVSGRATICWEATLLSEQSINPNYVVKDSWRQIDQRGEGRIYQMAKEAGVHGLLDLVSEGEVADPGNPDKPDTVFEGVRRGCTGAAAPSRRNKRKTDGPTGDEPSSKRLSTPASRTRRASAPSLDGKAFTPLPDIVDRVRVRLLFRDAVGVPLSRIPSAREFFAVIRDALQCHHDLYMKAGILHRDVSVYNILATTPEMVLTGKVKRVGMLFDFDYALPINEFHSGAHHRTGTLPFLAVRVLKGRYNTYGADLESFFYVMCYGCVYFTGEPSSPPLRQLTKTPPVNQAPKQQKRDSSLATTAGGDQWFPTNDGETPLGDWWSGTEHLMASTKINTLDDPICFRDRVVKHFTPIFQSAGVERLMKKLRSLVVKTPWFNMNALAEEIEQREKRMRAEQEEWEAALASRDGKFDEAESPAAKLRKALMEEDDKCALELFHAMMLEITDALKSDDF